MGAVVSSQMAARILAQVLIVGGQVVGRAVLQAYRQALQNGKAGGMTAAVTRGMRIEEARQVLNVTETATNEEILKAWERYRTLNAPAEGFGGSPYIQAKLTNA